MTAQILTNELGLLLTEAKRRSGDLRAASLPFQKSLAELKILSSSPENEVARELSRKPHFPSPFILACASKHPRLTAMGISCLQRLIVAKALSPVRAPIHPLYLADSMLNIMQARLKEVLDAFRDAVTLGPDIQLKILQALPSLLQNYAASIEGPYLEEALTICSSLQGTKVAVVNSTAAATLQQLIISVFDKVASEDDKASEIPTTGDVSIDGETISLRPAAIDAYKVFQDLCLQTEGQKPQHVQFTQIPQPFGLELIESVLSNHYEIFLSHKEQAHIVRARVAPFVIRSLSNKTNFPIAVRVIRIFYVLIRRHLSILESECEVALGLLMHMLDPDTGPGWKRALCMEVVRGLFAESSLIRRLYNVYDAQKDKRPVLKELTAMLARLATEKPSVIGLGTQSSIPMDQNTLRNISNEQLAMEAGGVAGIIGGAVGMSDGTAPGLSPHWSSVRVPCIEQLDKTEPPSTPESYLYALVLSCVNSFSEGLAKFILPLASPLPEAKPSKKGRLKVASQKAIIANDSDATSGGETPSGTPPNTISKKNSSMKRRFQGILNPLTIEDHPLAAEIQTIASIVDSCWPAVLALYSTYLYATLDNDYYHSLVRSLQKFTQVAGVLDLGTPRDTFLTTLGKAAVPPQVLSSHVAYSGHGDTSSTSKGDLPTAPSTLNIPGADYKPLPLNVRNLICLRALLNVGTALGTTLKDSWTIVLEALQQTDYILQSTYRASTKSSAQSIKSMDSQRSVNEGQTNLSNVGPEIAAVEGTSQKLFESTKEFNNEAFRSFLAALCELLALDELSSDTTTEPDSPEAKRDRKVLPVSPSFGQHRLSTFGMRRKSSAASSIDNTFVISKLGELVQVNIERLITEDADDNGWNTIQHYLLLASTTRGVEGAIRLKASDILHEFVILAARTLNPETSGAIDIQERILKSLLKELQGLEEASQVSTDVHSNTVKLVDADIHKSALEALTTMLEQSGENLKAGWGILFSIMNTAFKPPVEGKTFRPAGKSIRLLKTSFASLQLICTDFLGLLPIDCVLVLIDTLYSFCAQVDDLNISLTTITYFWNISDFLQRQKTDKESEHDFPNTDKELLDAVRTQGSSTSMVLWLILLLRLAEITKDPRSEVRNGSIQTLFRIFDSYGHILGPKAWGSCLNIVVFKMMSTTETLLQEGNLPPSERKQWDETVVLILKGTSNLYTNFLNVFQLLSSFDKIWSTYIQYLRHLLGWRSFEVTKTVYKELARLLEKATVSEEISVLSKRQAWDLWALQGRNLVEGVEEGSHNNSQETLTAFINAFKPLYKLMGPILETTDVQQALGVFRDCMLYPELPAYFFDVETLSALQASILDSIKTISTQSTDWTSLILKEFAFLSRLPYKTPAPSDSKARKPSYVAVSSTILASLSGLCLKHASAGPDIYDSGAISDVLDALCEPIQLKYKFHAGATTKRETLWIQATRVSLGILANLIPILDAMDLADDRKVDIWDKIVNIACAVVTADCDDEDVDVVLRDEEFDISAFAKVRALVIPRLGRDFVPFEVKERYVESIFNASLLYKISDGELGISFKPGNRKAEQLFGCTSDLELERRSKVSYKCLDELFELCGEKEDSSGEWESLAKVAIPWMLVRVSVVLRRFAADQPLRGRTPQPRCQRKEIIYIMDKFTRLQCANFDSGAAELVTSVESTKRHLLVMFPFISQAVRVATADSEVLVLLTNALNEIGSMH
ncbi:hypothetical protein H072_5374 [Dactylellina haptotyla CBS 200.50]|uniref:Protein MON2 homolog n=1 Tax=Dactylellina haptotyla (strain CBS 200.50) TaxID=1284197 RepID=S8AHV1_DACHA|nr:hypothetical protein H072_5374 [Dactylellina haptotyla CBS 200.50]